VAAVEGVPAMRVRVLRPLEEPLGGVVCHVDLRQPDQEPRLPATPLVHHDESVTYDGRHGLVFLMAC